jgi:hypothetical protein
VLRASPGRASPILARSRGLARTIGMNFFLLKRAASSSVGCIMRIGDGSMST